MNRDEAATDKGPVFVGDVADIVGDTVSEGFFEDMLVERTPIEPGHIGGRDVDDFTRSVVRPVLSYLGYDTVGEEDYGFRARMSNGKKIAFVVVPMNHELSSAPVDVRDLLLNECMDFVAVTDGLRWVYAFRHGEIVSLGDVIFDSAALVKNRLGIEGGREPDPKMDELFNRVFGYERLHH